MTLGAHSGLWYLAHFIVYPIAIFIWLWFFRSDNMTLRRHRARRLAARSRARLKGTARGRVTCGHSNRADSASPGPAAPAGPGIARK
jgi:hypothetical protein